MLNSCTLRTAAYICTQLRWQAFLGQDLCSKMEKLMHAYTG